LQSAQLKGETVEEVMGGAEGGASEKLVVGGAEGGATENQSINQAFNQSHF